MFFRRFSLPHDSAAKLFSESPCLKLELHRDDEAVWARYEVSGSILPDDGEQLTAGDVRFLRDLVNEFLAPREGDSHV